MHSSPAPQPALHAPQWVSLLFRSASQPLVAIPSQLENPLSQASVQVAFVQVTLFTLGAPLPGQLVPQLPQSSTSSRLVQRVPSQHVSLERHVSLPH